MADYLYVKIEGADGMIEGSCTDAKFEKHMVVYAYDQTCFFNYDDVQGRTTSNQHCAPVACTMKLDESAPELLKRFRKAAPLKVTFIWTDKDKNGAKVPSFQTELVNARIVKFKQFTPHTKDNLTQELDHSV